MCFMCLNFGVVYGVGVYGVVQEDTACTRLDSCRHLHKLCLHNPCPRDGGPISVLMLFYVSSTT